MLRLGFVLDDYKLLAHVEGVMPQARPLDYFSFARDPAEFRPQVERGPFPWWTWPGIQLAFFRPLSSATIWLDHALFGRAAWAWHAHSLLWYLALILAAAAFYRRTLPAAVAGVALVAYAIDNVLWLPVGWLANRNTLIAAVPTVLALAAHVRWRDEGWAPGRWLAPLGLAVGLMGGESALAYAGYFVAYEGFAKKPGRVAAVLPVLVVLVGWAAVYRALGYGASGSDTYVDPGAAPLEFLGVAVPRFLVALGALTLKTGADWWVVLPQARPAMYASGVVGGLFVGFLVRRCWPSLAEAERFAVKWMAAGAVLAIVPVLATFPADRLLAPPSLGTLGVLAIVFRAVVAQRRRLVAGVLLTTQALVPIPSWFIGPAVLTRASDEGKRVVREAPDALFRKRVVFLNAGEVGAALYGAMYLRVDGRPVPDRWWLLSLAPSPHRLTRAGPQALELEVVGGRMLDRWYERLVRAERFSFAVGDVVRLDGARITLTGVDGGKPTKIRVDFDLPLEQHTLVRWKDGKLAEVPPPAEGETVALEAEPSPLELKF